MWGKPGPDLRGNNAPWQNGHVFRANFSLQPLVPRCRNGVVSPITRQELRFEGLPVAQTVERREVLPTTALMTCPVSTIAAGGQAVAESTGEEQTFAPGDKEELKKCKQQTAKAAAQPADE